MGDSFQDLQRTISNLARTLMPTVGQKQIPCICIHISHVERQASITDGYI